MSYLLYVVVKLACYITWCWLGLWLWRPHASFGKALAFGVLRLVIGVVFGTVIFLAAGAQPEGLLWNYLAIYTPVRFVEWFILAWLIRRAADTKVPSTPWLWCLGGIVVSFVADFASPAGVAGHFCVGRCLC